MTTIYPHAPGYKGEAETGRKSATKVAGKAAKMREAIKDTYRWAVSGLTHDECAGILRPEGMTDVQFEQFKRSVRSRCSELMRQGLIEATNIRRENASGHEAVVWRLFKVRYNETQVEFEYDRHA